MNSIIILAAGIGRRFSIDSNKNEIPKCLIELDNSKTILEMNLEKILSFNDIKHIYIVTGYKYELVKELLYLKYPSMPIIKTVYNPDYEKSIMYSIKKGFENIINESVLLLNGDTYFEKDIITEAYKISQKDNDAITLFGYLTNEFYNDDMLLNVIGGKMYNVGKDIINANGVSSGAIHMCNRGLQKYINTINLKSINKMEIHHKILKFISESGYDIDFVNLGSRKWLEVDEITDLDQAKRYNA